MIQMDRILEKRLSEHSGVINYDLNDDELQDVPAIDCNGQWESVSIVSYEEGYFTSSNGDTYHHYDIALSTRIELYQKALETIGADATISINDLIS